MFLTLTHWPLKSQLLTLIAIVVLGFLTSALINQAMMGKVAVNGPAYNETCLQARWHPA